MNKLDLRGISPWFAADIHLGEPVPETACRFYEFLACARQKADALVLCGDIFDVWIGDDHALQHPPAWLHEAMQHLRATAHDIPLWLMRGNRDFLMGTALAQALGARLLEAPVRLATDAGDILLAHGDEYCLDDPAYQRFRRIVHVRWIQQAFLGLPLALRRRIAAWTRARSRRARSRKPLEIMDVRPQAILQALRTADCRQMIHGHTHRPAIHALTLDGAPAARYVLPDWELDHATPPRWGWISIDADGIHLHQQESWDPAAAPLA